MQLSVPQVFFSICTALLAISQKNFLISYYTYCLFACSFTDFFFILILFPLSTSSQRRYNIHEFPLLQFTTWSFCTRFFSFLLKKKRECNFPHSLKEVGCDRVSKFITYLLQKKENMAKFGACNSLLSFSRPHPFCSYSLTVMSRLQERRGEGEGRGWLERRKKT